MDCFGAVDGMGISADAAETSAAGALGSLGGVVEIMGVAGDVAADVVESCEERLGKRAGGG